MKMYLHKYKNMQQVRKDNLLFIIVFVTFQLSLKLRQKQR